MHTANVSSNSEAATGKKLWLIGMMGSGKTTVGSIVAGRVGAAFVDTDGVVEEKEGHPISDIFATVGEAGFRRLEADAIRRAAEGPPAVIATGGGSVLLDENLVVMKHSGTVVWLSAHPDSLAERVGSDTARPLLGASDPAARMRALLANRRDRYAAAADHVVESGRPSAEVVADVEKLWNES